MYRLLTHFVFYALQPPKRRKISIFDLWSDRHYAIYHSDNQVLSRSEYDSKSIVDSPHAQSVAAWLLNERRTCELGIHHCTCSPQLLSLYTNIREIFHPLCKLGMIVIVVRSKKNTVAPAQTASPPLRSRLEALGISCPMDSQRKQTTVF